VIGFTLKMGADHQFNFKKKHSFAFGHLNEMRRITDMTGTHHDVSIYLNIGPKKWAKSGTNTRLPHQLSACFHLLPVNYFFISLSIEACTD